ncbi:hypothetical protein [Rothia sp. ZJ1223]|uniref:hypothetical protein n=1 Tax=Rothia sp. ZJ1223 TaxID=2811098 RepID=UPI00195B411F|nr:hypothetical protein [Rothia sp. ZJ1223]MBM7051522.1 hypothetical protein [Rothia sp. ZJ1223]
MAEHAHQVPDKYGEVVAIYHPRINSYFRRIMAALPALLLSVGILGFLAYKRPVLPFAVVLVLILLVAFFVIYSFLKPTIIVRTETHVMCGRMIGWQAVPLADIAHTVFVEHLAPKKTIAQEEAGKKIVAKGAPALWAVNEKKKRLMRVDGRIWDAKTMRKIASEIAPQTTVFSRINVVAFSQQWPGLVTFNELHPGWRSAAVAITTALVLGLIAFGFLAPDDLLRQYNLLPGN